jgi:hypothetical protein
MNDALNKNKMKTNENKPTNKKDAIGHRKTILTYSGDRQKQDRTK